MMQIKLVHDWRKAWTWISVNAMAVAAAVQIVWLQLPTDMKTSIDSGIVQYLTLSMLVVGVVGRLVKQGKDDAEQPQA